MFAINLKLLYELVKPLYLEILLLLGAVFTFLFEKLYGPSKQFKRTACGPIFASLICLMEMERNSPLLKQNTAVLRLGYVENIHE